MFERREDAAPAAVGHHRGRDGQQPVVGHEVGDARVRRHRERQVEAAGDPRRRDHDDVEVGERVEGRADEVAGVDVLRSLTDEHDAAPLEVAPPRRQRQGGGAGSGEPPDAVDVLRAVGAPVVECRDAAGQHELTREHDLLERLADRRQADLGADPLGGPGEGPREHGDERAQEGIPGLRERGAAGRQAEPGRRALRARHVEGQHRDGRPRAAEHVGDDARRDGGLIGGKDVPRLTVPLPAEVGELRRGGRDEEVLDVDHDLGEALLPDQAGEGRGQVVLVEVGRGLPRHEPRPGGLHPGAERRPGVEPHVVAGVGEGPRDRGDRDDVPREGHRHEQESCRRCSRGWDGCGSAAVASQSAGHSGHQARPVPIAIGGPRRGAQSVATGESSAIAASSPARPGDSAISAPMRPAAPR